ncbi:MAG: hypothetical protein LQ338_006916, partial [Usnochroma carphineum]
YTPASPDRQSSSSTSCFINEAIEDQPTINQKRNLLRFGSSICSLSGGGKGGVSRYTNSLKHPCILATQLSLASTLAPSTPVSLTSGSSPNGPSTVIQTTSIPPTTIVPATTSTFDAPTPNSPPPTTPSPPPPDSTTGPAAAPVLSTSLVTQSSDNNGGGNTDSASDSGPHTILLTSTAPPLAFPKDTNTHTTSSRKTSSTTSGAALATSSPEKSNSGGGLPTGGRIAVAVVVPIAAVALLVLAGLFLWRKRKQRKDAEELRRKEVEEYGFNPNNDPTLPAVGGASSNGDDPSEMREADGAGYRGWGTTTSATRKQSATLSSGNGGIGIARSGSGSDPGGYHAQGSPTAGTNQSSDVHSGDPLVGNGRPLTGDSETIGALGAGPAANGNRQDREIHRGPSNASSAYSGGHRSDTSGDGGGAAGQQYYREYYDETMPQHGPYGDGTYGGGQPVIRDVPARRNTRIENPSVFPQQGSSGIAQNF